MSLLKVVKYLVVHCTATPLSQRVSVEDIDRWHKAKGWSGIGYHWYVDRDGHIFPGRSEREAGAHVIGYNHCSIGICYEGGLDEQGNSADTRTPAQKAALLFIIKDLKQSYPNAIVLGHRDFPGVHKDCPCFDAKTEYSYIQ
ncbi:MAG: N-acetylmuramoyl-L-alanine amidase [Bacteroidaceae bacterium]|nr:N-acetylmuramoyl-L-alanine amidase [Bacteroidaceae bacterium]